MRILRKVEKRASGKMCGDCYRMGGCYLRGKHRMSFPCLIVDVEEEVKMLEECKEALLKEAPRILEC